jgi:hypothetical protein
VAGYERRDPADRELRDSDFPRFLDERIYCDHGDDIRAVGFKMPYEHFIWFLEMEGWIASQPDLHIVHLRRRNLLRSLASVRVAQATGGWVEDQPYSVARAARLQNIPKALRHPLRAASALWRIASRGIKPTKEPEWKAEREPVRLSVEESRYYFKWATSTAEHYDQVFNEQARHTVYYEDIVDAKRDTLNAVQEFLGASPSRLVASTRRQNPEPLSQLIANYDELYDAFSGTEYASFLD